jgi:hypothetical protein
MKELNSFGDLAKALATAVPATITSLDAGMAAAGRVIQKDAKARIGSYQDAQPPFGAWPPLTPQTQAERVAQGFTPDDPLLRTGELRDSIVTEHTFLETVVGSKMPIAAYQEYGTAHVPPRPFIGPAAVAKMDTVCKMLGTRAVLGLSGRPAIDVSYGASGQEDA